MKTNGVSGAWRREASSRFSVPTALTSKSSNGRERGEVVRGLRRRVDDEVRPRLADEPLDPVAVADVEVVVLEPRRLPPQPLEVPGRVAVLPEEVAAHVVVDPVHAPAALVEEGHALGADQAARARDDRSPGRHGR